MNDERHYTIEELTQLTGVPARTVRLYVQRGLVPPAAGRGRGRHYCEEHLAALQRVQELKRAGHKLEDIKEAMAREDGCDTCRDDDLLHGTRRILLAEEGIWLEVGPGVALPSPDALDSLVALCRRELGLPDEEPEPRIAILSKLDSVLFIRDGLKNGKSLRIGPRERMLIREMTPAIEKAESDGHITILGEPQ